MDLIPFSAAKKSGLIRYFPGTPCKRGHIAQRLVSSRNCCKCREEWQASDVGREKRRQRSAAYYAKLRSTPEGCEELRRYAREHSVKYLSRPEVREKRRLANRSPNGKASARRTKLRLKYGMTIDQYDAMLLAQDFGCAICREKKHLHVDHDHSTGKVRGLLCQRCNAALGLYDDDPHRLERAAAYLREHRDG